MLLDNVSMGFNFSRPGQSSQTAIQGSDWLISQVKYTSIKLFFTADCQQDLFLHLVFSYPVCVCYLCNVGTSEAFCGGFLPAHSASNYHSRRTEPLLERGATAAI